MKISMYGAWDPRFGPEGGGDDDCNVASWVEKPGRELNANTLGEAIAAYTEQFGVSIRPYDGSNPRVPFDPAKPCQYFIFEHPERGGCLTAASIERGDQLLSPTENLGFPLEEGDIVSISPVGC